jgi:hypothetical protein
LDYLRAHERGGGPPELTCWFCLAFDTVVRPNPNSPIIRIVSRTWSLRFVRDPPAFTETGDRVELRISSTATTWASMADAVSLSGVRSSTYLPRHAGREDASQVHRPDNAPHFLLDACVRTCQPGRLLRSPRLRPCSFLLVQRKQGADRSGRARCSIPACKGGRTWDHVVMLVHGEGGGPGWSTGLATEIGAKRKAALSPRALSFPFPASPRIAFKYFPSSFARPSIARPARIPPVPPHRETSLLPSLHRLAPVRLGPAAAAGAPSMNISSGVATTSLPVSAPPRG